MTDLEDSLSHYIDQLEDRVWISELCANQRLSGDSFDLLREESRFHLKTLEQTDLATVCDTPAQAEPTLTFDSVEIRFTNQLKYGSDYTLPELDAFVDSLSP